MYKFNPILGDSFLQSKSMLYYSTELGFTRDMTILIHLAQTVPRTNFEIFEDLLSLCK